MGDFKFQIGTEVKNHVNHYKFLHPKIFETRFIPLDRDFKGLLEHIHFCALRYNP